MTEEELGRWGEQTDVEEDLISAELIRGAWRLLWPPESEG